MAPVFWFVNALLSGFCWHVRGTQVLCGGKLAGLNCRLRLYRYDSGNVYRPHVDGAWPGSGIKNGKVGVL